ncbi:MAG: hypothetical protein R3F62_14935 [Planctomycetota bacterium]
MTRTSTPALQRGGPHYDELLRRDEHRAQVLRGVSQELQATTRAR